jgi:hypothetical protein
LSRFWWVVVFVVVGWRDSRVEEDSQGSLESKVMQRILSFFSERVRGEKWKKRKQKPPDH